MLLANLRQELCELHAELPKNHLVAWTSGNISARDPASGLIAIKPSGLRFAYLTAASMVVVDPQGQPVDGEDDVARPDSRSIGRAIGRDLDDSRSGKQLDLGEGIAFVGRDLEAEIDQQASVSLREAKLLGGQIDRGNEPGRLPGRASRAQCREQQSR